jgi:hypothetical protein
VVQDINGDLIEINTELHGLQHFLAFSTLIHMEERQTKSWKRANKASVQESIRLPDKLVVVRIHY